MDGLNQHLITQYKETSELHAQIYNELSAVKDGAKDGSSIVDAVFILKKTYELIDDTRKEINKTLDHLQKLGCLLSMQTGGSLSGEIASGYANTRTQPYMPDANREPAEYACLMMALGVPDNIIASRRIKPSFTGIGDYIAKLSAEGKPIPPALQSVKSIDKYTIVARAKSGVDFDAIVG